MKYKVGDKVRVRTDLENGKRYGNNSVVDDMTSLCGKEVEIAVVLTGGYKVNGNFWTWTDEMFEERRRVEVEEKYINDLMVKVETLEKEIKELKGEELLPCPFCGNEYAPKCLNAEDISQSSMGDRDNKAVCCRATKGGCGATGRFELKKEDAIKAWNRRV